MFHLAKKLLYLFPFLMYIHSLYSQDIPIHINLNKIYQTIQGFGGFGAKKVWWDSPPHYDQAYLNQVIDTLGCTFIRTQIYWDAEPVNDNDDPMVIDWSKFKFETNTDNGKQFNFIRDAGLRGAKILATVWTPPIWMKGLEEFHGTLWGNSVRRRPSDSDLDKNCSWCGGSAGCLQVGGWLKPDYYQEFAEYLVAYVKKVKETTGVDIWAINIQNEPYFPNPFESCVVIPSEYADILKTVGERFVQEGISTRLFGPEHMGEVSWGINNEYIKEILEDASVNPYLSFFAVHSYVDGVAPDYGSAEGWDALYRKVVTTHGKELWMTETSDFDKQGFDLGFSMAKSLYLALKFGHISGWIYWAMADYVIKNNQLTPLGRSFQQYYRFLRPGAVMVDAETDDARLLVVAGRKDNNLAVVIINNSPQDLTVRLDGTGLPDYYACYRTSSAEKFSKLADAGVSGIPVKANSITTLYHEGSTTAAPKPLLNETIEITTGNEGQSLKIINAQNCQITLNDLQGRCIMQKKLYSACEPIELRHIHTGAYLVTVSDNNRRFMQKVILGKGE
jgi:O-glycosyl hydrolase